MSEGESVKGQCMGWIDVNLRRCHPLLFLSQVGVEPVERPPLSVPHLTGAPSTDSHPSNHPHLPFVQLQRCDVK